MLMEVRNVTKRFGGLAALSGVSFDLEEGQILGIIGPNGAGKTTLFNTICGISSATEGEILYQGEHIEKLSPHEVAQKGIARAFQVVKPFGNMTTLENVMVGAFCRTNHRSEAERLAMDALKKVYLDTQADKMAKNLNLGQRKRLEIAKALATQPKLLLLDEVMAGLTPPEVREIVKVIQEINAGGVTILLIEHIMEAIMSLSHHIIVISFGKKIAEGTPEEVANNKLVQEAYFGVEDDEILAGEVETHA